MASPIRLSPIPNQTLKFPSSSSAPTTAICSSSFGKRVILSKWWLIKTEAADSLSKGLGVGGFAFTKGQGIRIFRSATISKRHDTNSIETINGITINLIGLIDEPRTCKNGFPSKFCEVFHFGFPYDWEEYVPRNSGEESNNDITPEGVSNLDCTNNSNLNLSNIPLPTSFDDIPVSQVCDLLMYPPTSISESCAISRIIVNDIFRKCNDNTSNHSGPTIHLNDETEIETPIDHCRNIRDDNCISNEKTMCMKESSKKLDNVRSNNCSRLGVATRSMRKRECQKPVSVCEPEACNLAKTGASNGDDVVAANNLFGETGNKGNRNKSAIKKYKGDDLAEISGQAVVFGKMERGGRIGISGEKETEEVGKFSESAVRRSKRLKNRKKMLDI